jgi:hypothetical protein
LLHETTYTCQLNRQHRQVQATGVIKVLKIAFGKSNFTHGKVVLLNPTGDLGLPLWYQSLAFANMKHSSVDLLSVQSLDKLRGIRSPYVLVTQNAATGALEISQFGSAAEPFLISGDYSTDSWAGKNLSITVGSKDCKALSMSYWAPPQFKPLTLTITSGSSPSVFLSVTSTEAVYKVANPVDLGQINLKFDRTYVPYEVGMGQDRRELAAHLNFKCSR